MEGTAMTILFPAVLAIMSAMPSLPPVSLAQAIELNPWHRAETEMAPISCEALACGIYRIGGRRHQFHEDPTPADLGRRQLEGLPKRRIEPDAPRTPPAQGRQLAQQPWPNLALRKRLEPPRFSERNRPRPFVRDWRDENWPFVEQDLGIDDTWHAYRPRADARRPASSTNPLSDEINAALRKIEEGRYAEALARLSYDVLSRTDGCATAGRPDENDWIDSCADQLVIYQYVQTAIGHLRILVYGS
jgi:hypothetical protein